MRNVGELKETTLRVKHEPQYGQFYLQDPSSEADLTNFSDQEIGKVRLAARPGLIAIFVKSEFNTIPVELEVKLEAPPLDEDKKWDKIVESPLAIKSSKVVLAGCPDGPVYGKFGEVNIPSGDYTARIFYGGQSTLQSDGSTNDFYKIQIWPGKLERPAQILPHG